MNQSQQHLSVLFVYTSTDGQTLTIIQKVAKRLQAHVRYDIVNLCEQTDVQLSDYQLVVIGASIRYGVFGSHLFQFVQQYYQQLNKMDSFFFSVSLIARKPEKRSPQTNVYTRKFLAKTPWKPKETFVFAGALRYPIYRWYDKVMIKLIMKMTHGVTDSSQDIEYTDWNEVEKFADHLLGYIQQKAL